MSKFFIPPERIKGDTACIVGPEAHHILDVMRLKSGDRFEAFDGSGRIYRGRILNTEHKQVQAQLEQLICNRPRSNLRISLAQALPKRDKMDCIVEKATELGVETIIPMQTARTVVRLNKARQLSRQRRWQRLSLEAVKQCGRTTLVELRPLADWREVLSALDGFDLKLLFCLSKNAQSLKTVFRSKNRARRIALLVGPEGDFTPAEIQQAEAAGCLAVSLGENVLKSDTAAISALAMVNYALG